MAFLGQKNVFFPEFGVPDILYTNMYTYMHVLHNLKTFFYFNPVTLIYIWHAGRKSLSISA